MVYNVDNLNIVDIGWTGEKNARTVSINVKRWLDKWPDATFTLYVRRPGETSFHTVPIERKNHFVMWRVGGTETEIPGHGRAILCGSSELEDVIAKRPFHTRLAKSPDTDVVVPPSPPDEYILAICDEFLCDEAICEE